MDFKTSPEGTDLNKCTADLFRNYSLDIRTATSDTLPACRVLDIIIKFAQEESNPVILTALLYGGQLSCQRAELQVFHDLGLITLKKRKTHKIIQNFHVKVISGTRDPQLSL